MKIWKCEKGHIMGTHDLDKLTTCLYCGAIHIWEVITVDIGSREWGAVTTIRGGRVRDADGKPYDIEHTLRDFMGARPGGWTPAPPPWEPKQGERVRWKRDDDSGTGSYNIGAPNGGHEVWIGSHRRLLWVESVEPLESERG